jgi:hypothetical protein
MKYLAPLVLLTLSGCATQPPSVTSWLDPVSSATITAQAEPMVLARPETRLTANGRDYAQLTAIEVNRMGDRKLYLVAVLWSNANLSVKEWRDFETTFGQIEVRLDNRPLALTRHSDDVSALGVGQSPLPLPMPGTRQIYFPIQRADLRALAQSQRVQLLALGRADAPQRFEERQDGRKSLNDFLSQLPGESASAR